MKDDDAIMARTSADFDKVFEVLPQTPPPPCFRPTDEAKRQLEKTIREKSGDAAHELLVVIEEPDIARDYLESAIALLQVALAAAQLLEPRDGE